MPIFTHGLSIRAFAQGSGNKVYNVSSYSSADHMNEQRQAHAAAEVAGITHGRYITLLTSGFARTSHTCADMLNHEH